MTRVLVVEDSPTQAEKVRLILEGKGFEVETARDGQEGKEKLEASTFDLVVSDIVMPRLSGYELCQSVKADARTKDLPVILLTALNDPMDMIQALEAGADNFISKPYEPDYLVARIRSILENRRLRPEGKLSVNVDLLFMGRRFTIGSGKEQILGLLLSAFEDMVRTNRELRATQAELSAAKEKQEEYALKLEGRVQASEEMYATLMRQASDAILLFEEGVIIEANLQAASLAGRPVSEIVGRRAADFVTAARRGGMQALRDKVSVERSVQVGDFIVERPDGSTVEAEASVSSVEVQGRTLNLVLLRDVSERKRAEKALRASEEQFRAMFDSASVGVAQANPKTGRLSRVNPKLCLITGYSAEELLTRRFSDITHPDDRERDWTLFERMVTTGSSDYQTEKRYVRKDGAIVWANVNVTILRDATGAPPRTIAIITDITERKRAEEASARFLAGSPAVIYALLLAPDGFRVSWFSENIQSLTGYTGAEIRAGDSQRWWEQGIHPDDLPRVVAANQAVLDEGHAMLEFRFRRKDGSWIWMHDEKRVLFDPENRPSEVVGSWMDVTARVRLEEQLLHAQKMEAVGRLAGGVAHDFNNILTVIGGYSEVLLKTLPEGEPAHRHVTEIGMAAKRAAALTRQLLTFSRKQVLEPKVLDLNTIASSILGFLSRLLGEDIEIVLELQKGLGLVKADPGQIEQVITNLAVNARDAMPQGGKLILETQDVELDESYARVHPSVAAGPYVLLAASDTGCGMTPETVSHIFEPFFTTKEAGKGTGLGLSTVFGIVKQSGGEISVYSVPGEGTTFKIYLPRVSAKTGERDLASSPTIIRARPGETVLMVEDDEAVGRLTQSMLSDLGYDVLTASRGEEALEIAARQPGPIHLLLTDVVMPGLRGPEVATRLLTVHPETRVVFMSGYAAESLLHQTAVLGTAALLQKPFTSSTLGRKLREALDAVPLPEQQGAGVHGGRKPLSILHMDDDRDILEITSFFLAEDGHRVVGCLDVEETVARYAEALARAECFDLVLLDLSIPGKKGGVEGMREILKLDPTARIVACSGAGQSEGGPLESGFISIVEKPFTSESLKAILHLL
jgi:two-component system cell cycle sensor histidine kinase/response regulator CckA